MTLHDILRLRVDWEAAHGRRAKRIDVSPSVEADIVNQFGINGEFHRFDGKQRAIGLDWYADTDLMADTVRFS